MGQPGWVAALTPFSVDGMIVAASTTLLADSRSSGRGEFLPWALLVVGSVASLAANVTVAVRYWASRGTLGKKVKGRRSVDLSGRGGTGSYAAWYTGRGGLQIVADQAGRAIQPIRPRRASAGGQRALRPARTELPERGRPRRAR